jgi:hypothetical protein
LDACSDILRPMSLRKVGTSGTKGRGGGTGRFCDAVAFMAMAVGSSSRRVQDVENEGS